MNEQAGEQKEPTLTDKDYVSMGWIEKTKNKNLQEAEKYFRQAIALNPDSVEGTYGLGVVLKDRGEVESAVETFRKAIALLEAGAGGEDHGRMVMIKRLALENIEHARPGSGSAQK